MDSRPHACSGIRGNDNACMRDKGMRLPRREYTSRNDMEMRLLWLLVE